MLKTFPFIVWFLLTGQLFAENSLIDHIQAVKDSLVEVKTVYTKTMHSGRIASFERRGTGIIIDPSGLIVTNTHIIINAPQIFVILKDGTKCKAKTVFSDASYDFTFLKINAPHPLDPIAWAGSSPIQPGEEIMAIGNSDHDKQSILSGQVIGLIQGPSSAATGFLEVNLNLYKGDSGGPILDRQGRLLGLVMANKKSDGTSTLAIASDKIKEQYLRYRQNM